MTTILLEDVVFYAYHGFYKEEQTIGTSFIINAELTVDVDIAKVSDKLDNTLDYQKVYTVIKKEMEIPSKLLEHVVNRIITALFAQHQLITKIKIKLTKVNPPLGGNVKKVSVMVEKNRE